MLFSSFSIVREDLIISLVALFSLVIALLGIRLLFVYLKAMMRDMNRTRSSDFHNEAVSRGFKSGSKEYWRVGRKWRRSVERR